MARKKGVDNFKGKRSAPFKKGGGRKKLAPNARGKKK